MDTDISGQAVTMDIRGSSKAVVSETPVVKTMRKLLLTDEVYKFTGAIGAQTKETCDSIEDGDIMLTFLTSVRIYGYGFPTFQEYDGKENKIILEKRKVGRKMWPAHTCECLFWGNEEVRLSVVSLKGE